MVRRPLIFIGVLLTVLLLHSQHALAETRIALVIGNGSYESASLDSPPRDADLMAEALRSVNFEVTIKKNVDQKTMKALIRDFGRRLKKTSDAVGFFYYSGHGMQVKGRNYMIPVDANIEDEGDVRIDGVEANSILRRMGVAKAKVGIVVLDACRNNPFEKRFKGPGEEIGLSTMKAPASTLIAYATAPGDVADPGPQGGHSPYTEILASELRSSSASVLILFNDVSAMVYEKSDHKQRPYVEFSTMESFVFKEVVKARTDIKKAGPTETKGEVPPTIEPGRTQQPVITTAVPSNPTFRSPDANDKEIRINIENIVMNEYILGSVSNLKPEEYFKYKIVVYVHVPGKWYLHPYPGQGEGLSWASLHKGGIWKMETVKRRFEADMVSAILIDRDHPAPIKVGSVQSIPHEAILIRDLRGTPDYGKLGPMLD